jgi:hypothetical protein
MPKTRLKLPGKVALTFAVIHIAIVIVFAVIMFFAALEGSAQWQFGWMILLVVDWPISYLLFWEGWPSASLPLPYPFSKPRSYVVPALFHGVIGTLWYAMVGLAVGYLISRLGHLIGKLRFAPK